MSSFLKPVKLICEEPLDGAHYAPLVATIHRYIHREKELMSGWLDVQETSFTDERYHIQALAKEIRQRATMLVVVGNGGSVVGTEAILQALSGMSNNEVKIAFTGNHLSGTTVQTFLNQLHDEEIYLNIVSKSGSTFETLVAFRILRHYMETRYGNEAKNRIIITTEADPNNLLYKMAQLYEYRTFAIPTNVGGRFSVLTSVGLLPLQVAGVDVESLLSGACAAQMDLMSPNIEENAAYEYAVYRSHYYSRGYNVELLASFEPQLSGFHEWWIQLFAESEGKDGKGLYPTSATFSKQLHSLGQFIQNGSPILFETILRFENVPNDFELTVDHLMEFDNKLPLFSLNTMNGMMAQSVVKAHQEANIPIVELIAEKYDAFHIGYLLYFFMKACTMSAYLLQVNPFDQPGVETYKMHLHELLNEQEVLK